MDCLRPWDQIKGLPGPTLATKWFVWCICFRKDKDVLQPSIKGSKCPHWLYVIGAGSCLSCILVALGCDASFSSWTNLSTSSFHFFGCSNGQNVSCAVLQLEFPGFEGHWSVHLFMLAGFCCIPVRNAKVLFGNGHISHGWSVLIKDGNDTITLHLAAGHRRQKQWPLKQRKERHRSYP